MTEKAYFGKNSIRPDFVGPADNDLAETYDPLSSHNEGSTGSASTPTRALAARRALTAAEQSATSNAAESKSGSGSSSTAKAIENSFSYTGAGKTSKARTARKAARAAKELKRAARSGGKLRKILPGLALVGIGAAIVFVMFGSISFLGSQLETLVTRATDPMFGSYSQNVFRITKELLDGKRGEFPEYFEQRLNTQGITVAAGGSALEYEGHTITSGNFDEVYKTNVRFREAFTKAKRGRSSNYFDKAGSEAFQRVNLTRNLFSAYKQTGDDATDNAAFRKTESDIFAAGTDSSINTVTEKQAVDHDTGEPMVDENGEPVMVRVESGGDISSAGEPGSATSRARTYLEDASKRVNDSISKTSEKVQKSGGLVCAALKVANLVSTAATVNDNYESINLFLSQQENISKTLAGDGDGAAMDYFLNDISETKTGYYIDAETGEKKEVTGSALEAEGFATALAGERADTRKTKNYTVEGAFTTSGHLLNLDLADSMLCGGPRVSSSVISLLGFATGGPLVKSIITVAGLIRIVNSALSGAIMALLSPLIPRLALNLFSNTYDTVSGIPAGETYMKGASLINAKIGRTAHGQMLASKEEATAYNAYTVAAAEMEAGVDREGRSPFDISSPNTFLGSLVGKLSVISGSSNALSAMSSVSSTVGNSVASIVNSSVSSAYAAEYENIALTADTTLSGTKFNAIFGAEDACKKLDGIGAACNMYGGEVVATNTDVINVASDDGKYLAVLEENVEEADGYKKVIEGSLLAKKIKYCDGRDSPFGVIDANILNDFVTNFGVLKYLPVIRNLVEIINLIESVSDEALGWARGVYCVMNEETNEYYEDMVYLQHFEEDQRIASQMHLAEVTDENGNDMNPITAYLEKYYEENPINTSRAGILAHFTGATMEDAELAIAVAEYAGYLASYTPPEGLPVTAADLVSYFEAVLEAGPVISLEEISVVDGVLGRRVEYNTIREKYHAA